MATITTILRAEIARISRRELKASIGDLRKAVASGRATNAELRGRVVELERHVRSLTRELARATKTIATSRNQADSTSTRPTLRFRPQGMASHRERLGLSAGEFGKLIGASAKSVYMWEQGKTRPGERHLAAIAKLRTTGKREAQRQLQAK